MILAAKFGETEQVLDSKFGEMNQVLNCDAGIAAHGDVSHISNKNNPHEVTAEQIGARPNTWMPTANDVGARSNTWMPTANEVGARPSTWTPTAAQVGARPNTWMPTASDVGAPTMDYAKKVGAPHNLLDNSNFTNIVNQRNVTSSTLTTGQYFWDRWRCISGAITWNANGAVFADGATIQQRIPYRADLVGANVTFVWYYADDSIEANTTTLTASGTDFLYQNISPLTKNKAVKYIALYVGEYTAETAPKYQPKGYAAELMECRRYFYNMGLATKAGCLTGAKATLRFGIPLPVIMRLTEPTVTEVSVTGLRTSAGSIDPPTINTVTATIYKDGWLDLLLNVDAISAATNNTPVTAYVGAVISADL